MSRVAQMRLVEFAYKPEIAERWGLSENDRHRVGVIAQGEQSLISFIIDGIRGVAKGVSYPLWKVIKKSFLKIPVHKIYSKAKNTHFS